MTIHMKPDTVALAADWVARRRDTAVRKYQLPGFALVARGATTRLADILLPAFAHLACDAPAGPVFTWEIQDIPRETAAAFRLPELDMDGTGTVHRRRDDNILVERRGPVITVFDPDARRISTLALEGMPVRSEQSAKPLLRFLFAMTESAGWYLAHAALVGFDGRGILVSGRGGMGKSTLTAACACAGAEIVGDDFVAVRRTQAGWIGHSLFTTLMLFEDQARHFPALRNTRDDPRIDNSRKLHITLEEAEGQRPVQSLLIEGMAIPRIVARRSSAIVPGHAGTNARAILPFSAFLPRPDTNREQAQALLSLASETEALTYESGSDFERIVDPLRDRFQGRAIP